MRQETTNKFAAILAAAQAKENGKTKPNFIAPKPTPTQPAQTPAKLPKQDRPELSSITSADLLNDATQANAQPVTSLKIVDYSDKSFAIISENKPPEDVLNILRQYGSYNAYLKCGKGWIFSKRHLTTIKEKLSL